MRRTFVSSLLSLGLLAGGAAAPVIAQSDDENSVSYNGLAFRNIGPAFTSGRISDFAVHPERHQQYYVGTASGGLWKTTSNGISWSPIFDSQGSFSIGVVELDPNNPDVVWVGTGENNSQRSVAYGDGVYRSGDGGKTWENMGLKLSEHLGQIVIDPRDSNTLYVAAQGPLWNSGGERGIYKTTDGGANWERVLHVDDDTGANEMVMHRDNPDHLVVSTYQRRRHVWTLINGGPGSGVHKSTDGGATWRKITNGLPDGDVGRIGLAAAPSAPSTVYAIIEAQEGGGVYRSTDFGESWSKQSDYVAGSPQYYNELIVDPNNPNRVYSMDTFMQVSEDGGANWSRVGVNHRHVDEHALWIDPDDSDHLITGNDGGVYESFDRGANWRHMRNLPLTQFYRATPDNDFPFYNVYGGTQDNASFGGPARTFNTQGIANEDWIVTLGGDGFKTQVDPENPDIVYSQLQHGNLVRFDKTTSEQVYITPQPGKGEKSYRWNWNSAFIISPHDNERLYFGAEKLFRSDDQGNSWRAVSGDLSRNLDRNELKVMGRIWSVDAVAKNASTSLYGSIISLAESPLQEGLIFVGTDDGLIQITEDGGENWHRIERIRGVPDMTYVGDLAPSLHNPDVVFATFDNHKRGDFKPYVFKSTDRGKSWRSIAGNLPERGTAHTIVQDHADPDLLFVGTEFGVFFTQNGGESWTQLKGGIPTIAVRDLEIQRRENDLVVGSFGRGFLILDDYTPLRVASSDVASAEATLFPVKDPWLYVEANRWGFGEKGFLGEDYFVAPNPPFGAVFSYYLKDGYQTQKAARQKNEKAAQKDGGDNPYPSWEELEAEDREEEPALIFTVRNASGDIVRRITGPTSKGFHRIAWDLRWPANAPIRLTPAPSSPFGGPPQGHLVAPGTYSVTVEKRIESGVTQIAGPADFEVKMLERGLFTTSDPAALNAVHQDVAALERAISGAGRAINELGERMDHVKRALLETPVATEDQNTRLRALESQLEDAAILLNGREAAARYNEQGMESINSRLGSFGFAQRGTLADVPPNILQTIEVAKEDFTGVLDTLHTVNAALTAIEGELGNAAPWTPGRIPAWPED